MNGYKSPAPPFVRVQLNYISENNNPVTPTSPTVNESTAQTKVQRYRTVLLLPHKHMSF